MEVIIVEQICKILALQTDLLENQINTWDPMQRKKIEEIRARINELEKEDQLSYALEQLNKLTRRK